MKLQLAVVAAICCLGAVHAQKKYAVLIGINQYQHARLAPLKFAVNDIEELNRVLTSQNYLTTMLTDRSDPPPTKENIQRALASALEQSQRGDTVLVALAGHGLQFDGTADAFFCPIDGRPFADRQDTLVSMKQLYESMERSFAGAKVLLVDACRDDPNAARSSRGLNADTAPTPPSGVAALFSCSAGQKSYEHERLGHGVFFHLVLEGLRDKARDRADNVTFIRLTEYVQEHIDGVLKDVVGADAKQQPDMRASVNGRVILAQLGNKSTGKQPADQPMSITNKPQPKMDSKTSEAAAATSNPDHDELKDLLDKKIESFTNSIGMVMVGIGPGKFRMGSTGITEKTGEAVGQDQVTVELTHKFHIGKFEVTEQEYAKVTLAETLARKEAKSTGKNIERLPVRNISWDNAQLFCTMLTTMEEKRGSLPKGYVYRLPTEAEWEFACRAGSTTTFSFGDDPQAADKFAVVMNSTGQPKSCPSARAWLTRSAYTICTETFMSGVLTIIARLCQVELIRS